MSGVVGALGLTIERLAGEVASLRETNEALQARLEAAQVAYDELRPLREGLVALIEERKHPRYGAGHGAIYVQELERLLGGSK